ncbi:gentisate 1,2-dioxygenase [Geomicrobium sp. JCM 19039]|nr:gentisate 1,2-dioxygenase [Geomicrobium sp. JCM 19039]
MAEKAAYLEDQDVKDFTKEIQEHSLGPLWEAIPALMNKTPKPHAVPYLWSDELMKQKLHEASQIFTPDRGGERRAIYFQNPGLTYRKPWGWASTTQTLYAAVQLLLPGEVAPSHRHSQSALRFITDGEGAYTIVEGERIFMQEGDFLITPKNLWHGHGHVGDEPMIWMDALDIPTIYSMGGTFFEPYPDQIETPTKPDNFSEQRYSGGMVRPIHDRHSTVAPLANYKWGGTEQALKVCSDLNRTRLKDMPWNTLILQMARLQTQRWDLGCNYCQKDFILKHIATRTQSSIKFIKAQGIQSLMAFVLIGKKAITSPSQTGLGTNMSQVKNLTCSQ